MLCPVVLCPGLCRCVLEVHLGGPCVPRCGVGTGEHGRTRTVSAAEQVRREVKAERRLWFPSKLKSPIIFQEAGGMNELAQRAVSGGCRCVPSQLLRRAEPLVLRSIRGPWWWFRREAEACWCPSSACPGRGLPVCRVAGPDPWPLPQDGCWKGR